MHGSGRLPTFAAVMTLMTDLDRPRMSLYKMNESLMIEFQNRINEEASPAVETKAAAKNSD
jgi:hypothetical protein